MGVNPITAVPTRLAYGPAPRATAWFADRKPEQFGTERLAEFVTEQHNPANIQHVTRIVVELPAQRLREGVVYVDTPGLGSLATSGAAETKAYLPRCDLGVVLIDAGSTLTAGRSGDHSDALRCGHPRLRVVEQGGFVGACGSGPRASNTWPAISVRIWVLNCRCMRSASRPGAAISSKNGSTPKFFHFTTVMRNWRGSR